MKQTAIVVAPGRGTYNRAELGYLSRHHANQSALIQRFDTYRTKQGQPTLSELDSLSQFSGATHTRGDNASALIHACAYADFLAIDREKFDILGVTGNSMGWYIALACSGALDDIGGFTVVNTMGRLMHDHMIGGQLIYPFTDDNWQPIPGARAKIEAKIAEIDARNDHILALSIDLGGMLVLAGNEAGLNAFQSDMPVAQERYPMRLPGHGGFHTALQQPVAKEGQTRLHESLFGDPQLALIDGRGAIWRPRSTEPAALHRYTLDHQVTKPYDFAASIRVAAREFMPDVFIVLGPGTTLGGAVAQCLLASHWRGMTSKTDFKQAQDNAPLLLSMGMEDQRALVIG